MPTTHQTENLDSQDSTIGPDRWSFKPALICLSIVAALELVCQLPGSVSFFLIPLSLIAYLVTALIIIGTAIYALFKRRPRAGASVLLMLALPVSLWRPIYWVADVVHLGLTVDFGIGQLGSSSKSQADSFAVYDWSVGLAGSNTFLIHDATGEIALPMAQHTHPLNSERFEEECAGKSERLISHYYVCTF